jgi:hypothetical protein
MVAETQLIGQASQRGRRHQLRFQLGLLALVVFRKLLKEHIGNGEPEDRVAEELQ